MRPRNTFTATIMGAEDDGFVFWPPHQPLALSPGPFIDGAPVGILPVEHPEDLIAWQEARQTPRPDQPCMATLAMGASPFLEKSDAIRAALTATYPHIPVHNWQADMVGRDTLARNLATGPQLAIYTGHGQAGSWSGYQVVRWETITQAPPMVPIGVLMNFACGVLAGPKAAQSFGARWVLSGRALCCIGATGPIKTAALMSLVDVFLDVLIDQHPQTPGHWLLGVNAMLRSTPAYAYLQPAFMLFRIVGDPWIPLNTKQPDYATENATF